MATRSTVSLDTKTAQNIIEEIEVIQESLDTLRKRIIELFPTKYGSDSWWKKEITEAKKEIKIGRMKELRSLNELDKPLDKLFT